MSDELVSIVMSTYNHAPYVGEAIESVFAQSHGNIEFLITDDGSSDGSVDEISKFRDSRIIFVPSTSNRGACTATNELIAKARGRYICVMNSDDIWCSPEKIRDQLRILRERPEVGATFGRARFIDMHGAPINKASLPYGRIFDQVNIPIARQQWLEQFFMHGNCLCHPTVMIRKECYERLGGYRNTLRQVPDFDMWIRLARHHEIHVSQEELVSFRILPGQNASSPTSANRIRDINENHLLRRKFFEGMEDEDFQAGFGKHFVRPDASDPISLRIEKALICFHKDSLYPGPDSIIGLERVQQLLEDPLAVNTLRFDYGIDDRWFHNKMTVMEHLSREPTTSPAVHSVEGRGLMGRLRRMCHTLRLRGCFSGCVRTEKIAAMGNRRI